MFNSLTCNIIHLYFIIHCYTKTQVNLGFLFAKNTPLLYSEMGFAKSGGVVSLVLDQIKKEKLIPDYNLTVHTFFDECIDYRASSGAYELISKHNVDVIFGSTCNTAAIRSSIVSRFYNVPSFIWGAVSTSDIADHRRLPNIFSTYAVFLSLGYATIDMLEYFNWTSVSFIYTTNNFQRCKKMYIDFTRVINTTNTNVDIVTSFQTSFDPSYKELNKFLNDIKDKTRIILSCFDGDVYKRRFLIAMYDNGFNNDEWVHINLEYKNFFFNTNVRDPSGKFYPFYKDVYNAVPDGRDEDALKMAKKMISIDLSRGTVNSTIPDKEILQNIYKWPFYCTDCYVTNETTIARYAWYLHDAIYLWASLLNKTLGLYGDKVFDDYSLFFKHCQGIYFGKTGQMTYGQNCIRTAYLLVQGLNKTESAIPFIVYNFSSIIQYSRSIQVDNLPTTMFANWGNKIPLNVPVCGYKGKACPIDIFKDYLTEVIIIGTLIFIFLLLAIILILYFIWKTNRRREEEMSRWMIPYIKLEKQTYEKNKIEHSSTSFMSNAPSQSSKNTLNSKKETKKFIFVYYNGEAVAGEKHTIILDPSKIQKLELSKLITWEHDNINKFYGMCLDFKYPLSIWRYCKRESLFDILQTNNSIFDAFFLICLIKDLVEGLLFIHDSFIQFHGRLTSKNCLINDRWQLKISNFNLFSYRCCEKTKSKDMLWTAPELLRDGGLMGSQEGDIYSFAIICSEILTRKLPWDYSNRKESVDELMYLVKRGGPHIIRPDIIIPSDIDINKAYITIIKDCWSEEPSNRPKIKQIKQLIKALHERGPKNLMDHVFGILEAYSLTLRREIEERTKELVEEQKKSDLLLEKMLPRAVAQKLKLVKFTDLSFKCSPIQIITLVNELYSMFDSAIENLDIYKVETIGDGYLCVSGLPTRNGTRHAEEIADLSLNFMDICKNFNIPHLPREKITLRIGCNTGPCVAGVVGLSMPRYCLFGDTVNTASRMESNGKGGKIHITESTFNLLNETGKYNLESRGEVIIKGKGVMTTYWLNSYYNNQCIT